MTDDISAFIAAQRARRIAAGKSTHVTAESVYRILDGLLANRSKDVVDHDTAA